MDKLHVTGPTRLKGKVEVSPAKNATLPVLTATLLCPFPVEFNPLPELNDISTLTKLIASLGAKVEKKSANTVVIDASSVNNQHADYSMVKTMRASVLVLGPLLARFGKAEVSLPGGCAIGTRPVDIHLSGMEKLGAKIKIENGYIYAETTGLKGTTINLSFPSVGATENLMMAAALASGETIIENAACEPEINDLANFLRTIGVPVSGDGTHRVVITGKKITELKPMTTAYRCIGDRIEAATYIIAALMTNGEVEVEHFKPDHLRAVIDVLTKMGAKFTEKENSIIVHPSGRLKGAHIETAPFPGFPTDVQAQMMAIMSVAEGSSLVTETIFENRFMHVPEMIRMGANLTIKGNSVFIEGVEKLSSAPVMCTDLRASAALVLCALVASGKTEIQRIYHLDRGYEKLEQKLKQLGANIERIK